MIVGEKSPIALKFPHYRELERYRLVSPGCDSYTSIKGWLRENWSEIDRLVNRRYLAIVFFG